MKMFSLVILLFALSGNCDAKITSPHGNPASFLQFIHAFPEWPNDSITDEIFFSGKVLGGYLWDEKPQIPKEDVKKYVPVEKNDKRDIQDMDLIYYGYGYRIETRNLHILFLTKDFDYHYVKPGVWWHKTGSVLTYNHHGKLLDHKDLIISGDLWEYRLSGSADRLQFFIESSEITNPYDWIDGTPQKVKSSKLRYDIDSKGKIKTTAIKREKQF